jgi:serine protease Do
MVMKLHLHVLASIAAFAGGGASVAHATPSIPTDGTIADVSERVVESVVNISVSHEEVVPRGAPDPFGGDPFDMFGGGDGSPHTQSAKGSGVIVTASGRILTNAHVVNGFEDIKVTLNDGTELAAKVIGKDPKADLAVIQLKGNFPLLKPLAFGDSSAMRLGDIVLAVGDGMGIGKSVSMGIVSAKGRGGMGIEEYEDFIQTDAAINPGNSGGALVNLKGELVGINTAIASRSGGYQGIGFAIPSNMARPIMDMLVRDGRVVRGYLGVNIDTVNASKAKDHKLGATAGVELAGIQPGGPADKAKLVEGDVVTALNGTAMKAADTLRNAIAMIRPGTSVDLDVVHRDGTRAQVKVKLGELPEEQVAQAQTKGNGKLPPGWKQMPNGWQCQQTQMGWQCQQNTRRP